MKRIRRITESEEKLAKNVAFAQDQVQTDCLEFSLQTPGLNLNVGVYSSRNPSAKRNAKQEYFW